MFQQAFPIAHYLSHLGKPESPAMPALQLLEAIEVGMHVACNVDLLSSSSHHVGNFTVVDFMLSQIERGHMPKLGRVAHSLCIGSDGEHLFRHLIFADMGHLFGVIEVQEYWPCAATLGAVLQDASWTGTAHLFASPERASVYARGRAAEWDAAANAQQQEVDCLAEA